MTHPYDLVRQNVDRKFADEDWDPSLFFLHIHNPEEGPEIKQKIVNILFSGVVMRSISGDFLVRLRPYEISEGSGIFMVPYGYADSFRQHAVEWACRRVQKEHKFTWLYCKTGTDSIAVAQALGNARPAEEP